MVLLMEYIVVGIYVFTGFVIPVVGKDVEESRRGWRIFSR